MSAIPKLEFPPFRLPPSAEALRTEVRAFLKTTLPGLKTEDRYPSWNTPSPEFSRALGAQGLIGITWPKKYGGQERSFLDRYVVTEELLAQGAPAGLHWVADRQSGPLLLRFGSEEQREAILPRITRGECYFCIGMSEPDSGSDLASVRTRAEPVPGGFRVNGTKVWTSGAHRTDYCIALVRTSGQHGDRQRGLSQLLIDLKSPGISIRPIINLAGRHDWNEVTFSDCLVPESALIGGEGDGWLQVTSELAFERSGPERFLTNFHVLRELVRVVGRQPARRAASVIGRLVARLWTLRQMSLAVCGMMEAGQSPAIEAALVKDLGTIFQQDLPEVARLLAESDATTDEDMADFLDIAQHATMMAPAYTIQGGTTQVLRGMVARGLGLR
ncbi:MAG: acyl-CoA dehydrogenase [Alphaproteobacteria bacterium]|nr:acyl-CoA dehydrogenase [Alphaproteobacteria bacterium]